MILITMVMKNLQQVTNWTLRDWSMWVLKRENVALCKLLPALGSPVSFYLAWGEGCFCSLPWPTGELVRKQCSCGSQREMFHAHRCPLHLGPTAISMCQPGEGWAVFSLCQLILSWARCLYSSRLLSGWISMLFPKVTKGKKKLETKEE